jgi:glycosyltransferase involved in cell wall biosynthesis
VQSGDDVRLLLLTQYYEPEVGAPQARLGALARAMRASGHEVDVLTALPNYPQGRIAEGYRRPWVREVIDGVRVTRVPLLPATGRGAARLASYLSFTAAASLGLLVTRRPTHVLIESPPLFLMVPGLLAARAWSATSIMNVADPWPDVAVELGALREGPALSAALALESWSYRHADLIASPTTANLARLEAKGVSAAKTMLLPNGADVERFNPHRGDPAALDSLGLPHSKLFVYAGTMGYAHGLDNLVQAAVMAHRRAGTTLALIGSGSERTRLERSVPADSRAVRFLDPVPPSRLAALLPLTLAGVVSLADIPANLGVRSAKMFPVMASGRPVLHIGRGEGAELVLRAGAGVVLDNDDPARIAGAMVDLAEHPDEAEEMGRRGRDYVTEELSWPAIAATLRARLGID